MSRHQGTTRVDAMAKRREEEDAVRRIPPAAVDFTFQRFTSDQLAPLLEHHAEATSVTSVLLLVNPGRNMLCPSKASC